VKSLFSAIHVLLAVCGFAVLTIQVFATTPVVTVTSPTIGGQYGSPVNFTASASSPDCANGISAMRIYTAPKVGVYTTNAAQLDVDINLATGSYNTVVQAWDNCGGVGSAQVNITVASTNFPPPRFFYITQSQQGVVAGYIVNPQSGELTFNGQTPVWAHWGPNAVASDSGGHRLYVANQGSFDVSAYVINRNNGHLTPVPGANFSTGGWNTGVAVHRSNKFVYVTTNSNAGNGGNAGVAAFSVSGNGSLVPVPGSPFLTGGGNFALAIDPKGKYLYATGALSPTDTNGVINAFKINPTTGALTALPGSPYPIIPVTCPACFSFEEFYDLAIDRNGNFLIGPGYNNGVIYVYRIDRSTGSLADVAGSPFLDEEPRQCQYCVGAAPISVTVQANNNFVFVLNQGDADNLVAYQLDAVTGALTMDSKTWGPYSGWAFSGGIRADPSGSFVYTLGFLGQPQNPYLMTGYMIDLSNGSLTPVPNAPYPTWQNNYANGLVVTQ
jgi:6-phosphogluconolactonase (cycloisomerase 2 family)